MVPMRSSTIFKSRWMALIWAAGILWVAYDVAGSAPQTDVSNNVTTDATGAAVSSDDANKAASVLGN